MSSRTLSLWRERLASPLTWHYAAFAVLLVTVIGMSIRFGLDWRATNDSSTGALAAKQVQLKALDLETVPLRGLDKRVAEPSYSSIATRIGDLALKGPVRLSRVQYTQGPPGSDFTEISMDAGITGGYPQIMRFVNGLERDQNFFVIRGMQLTGQQGGMVNLRLKVSTWLRPADAAASGLPPTPQAGDETVMPALPATRAKGGK
jgi:hypothetical protein